MTTTQGDLFAAMTEPIPPPPECVSIQQGIADVLESSWRTVASTFDRMDIAVEEMDRAGVDCFHALLPPPCLGELADRFYRAHARELCLRVASGGDLAIGTLAEVVAALHGASLRAPLTHDGTGLQSRAFRGVMDLLGEPMPPWLVDDWREPWDGAWDEMLSDARREVGRRRGSQG